MKLSRFIMAAALAGFAILTLGPRVQAQTPAFTMSDISGGVTDPRNFMLGWAFTVNTTLQVSALGVYDANLDGLSDAHAVGIFDGTGALLGSTAVSSGTIDPLINQFRYANLASPLSLAPGQTYTIGMFYPGGSADQQIVFANGFATDPRVNFIQDRQLQTDSFIMPTTTLGLTGIFGPNFLIGSAVPEPGTYAMIGSLGLTGAAFLRRKRAR